MNKTVSFKTLGCRLNLYETDSLASQFVQRGYKVDDDFENSNADILIINTCTITNQSDKKSREYISRAKRKGALVIVTGCMAEQYKQKLSSEEQIAFVVDNKHKNRIFDIVEAYLNGEFKTIDDFEGNVFNYQSAQNTFHTRSIIKVQDGCNNFCSYCIVPFVRGRAISRPIDDIIKNIKDELDFGFKEIVLTGVNISRYKYQGIDFEILVEKILEIPGEFRLRIASLEPDDYSDKFISLFKNSKLAPHIHLCLQSGSDTVLKRMRRTYSMSEFYGIVDRFRKIIPDFNFTTDIIVGFPNETEDEFQETISASKKIGFGHIHVFKYSRRKGTKADQMPNQVDEKIKNSRSKILRDLATELTNQNLKSMVGKYQTILTETIDKEGFIYGYGENYQRIKLKILNPKTNTFYKVKIVGIEGENLVGEVVE
ncbi:MAG: tRNA (N(6)-L-threonylcarbamoyladenosine(37)-C(2))-methylthiotransferase MtaB [Bacteroidales bacterium]|nr:tRNA (N(6)-L-threonylcarbamoyladenosine(37)-C(2))-methylthiotransferase MtaB [Bacteroidales bacterium]